MTVGVGMIAVAVGMIAVFGKGWLWLELRLLDRLWLLLSGLLCISLVDFVFYLVKQAEGLTSLTARLKSIETRIETLLRLSKRLLSKLLLSKLSLWLLSKLLPLWLLSKLLLGLLSK